MDNAWIALRAVNQIVMYSERELGDMLGSFSVTNSWLKSVIQSNYTFSIQKLEWR